MVNIVVGCTGSVATIKLPNLVERLTELGHKVKVITTKHAEHFLNKELKLPPKIETYTDRDEWALWTNRGDPVLHIELTKWADLFLIAPLDANTLAKITHGLCDNLLTCCVRAWELSKPLVFCPAMNTKMYEHPLTLSQIIQLKNWGYKEVAAIEKVLMCGDKGVGAMAEVDTIVKCVVEIIQSS